MKLLSITLATFVAAAIALPTPNDGATGYGALVKKQQGVSLGFAVGAAKAAGIGGNLGVGGGGKA